MKYNYVFCFIIGVIIGGTIRGYTSREPKPPSGAFTVVSTTFTNQSYRVLLEGLGEIWVERNVWETLGSGDLVFITPYTTRPQFHIQKIGTKNQLMEPSFAGILKN